MTDADVVLNALVNAKSEAVRRLSPSPVGDVPARIGGRLRLCEEETVERPYRAPVATMWYAEDVAALLAVIREKALDEIRAKPYRAEEVVARLDADRSEEGKYSSPTCAD